jgi:hypothetical protein
MRYQATFSFYGDKIHVPVEAESEEQATVRAFEENPAMRKKGVKVRVKELADGEQAQDDRATLQFAPVRQMGRPSQGRTARLQATITPEQMRWLEVQRAAHGDKSISDVIFRLLSEAMQ